MRKVGALISKDFTDLLKNPTMVVSCILPIGFAAIYRFMWADMGVDLQGEPGASGFMTGMLLTMALCMAVGMVCTLTVVSGIAEEKEKHTLRTLMLANVSAGQIVVARSVVTLVVTAVVEAASFFVAGAPTELFGPYMAIGVVGALPVLLFALVLGLASRDQMTASLYSVPLVLLAVLPMMGMASEAVGKVASYGPTGGMADLLALLVEGRLWTTDALMPLAMLALWTVLGVVVFALLFKRLTRDN